MCNNLTFSKALRILTYMGNILDLKKNIFSLWLLNTGVLLCTCIVLTELSENENIDTMQSYHIDNIWLTALYINVYSNSKLL